MAWVTIPFTSSLASVSLCECQLKASNLINVTLNGDIKYPGTGFKVLQYGNFHVNVFLK